MNMVFVNIVSVIFSLVCELVVVEISVNWESRVRNLLDSFY